MPCNINCPTIAAKAAIPSPSERPIATPIANINGRLLNIASPAFNIYILFKRSGYPNLKSRAAAGNTDTGNIKDFPTL